MNVDVGDFLEGISGGWEDEVVKVIFVAPDECYGDVMLENGEDAGVSFCHFKKIED
jgi:hypothetical protein